MIAGYKRIAEENENVRPDAVNSPDMPLLQQADVMSRARTSSIILEFEGVSTNRS